MSQSISPSSDTAEARRLAEEVVRRDDAKLTEALLADAIGHLCDEIDRLRARLDSHAKGVPWA